MKEAIKRINDLSDCLQDSKKANSALYMLTAGIAHGEGDATDYSKALSVIYDYLSEKIAEQQLLIDEINKILVSQGDAE